jgi:hypothetical protein
MTFPSLYFGICKHINLIIIEFQSIDNDHSTPQKKLFLPIQLL